jgi:hypothetical protein
MRCVACGDPISFWGEKCQFCGEEKSPLQATRILGILCMLGFAIIGWVKAGWLGAIGVGLVGAVIWASIEVVWNRLMRKRKRKTK